MKSDDAERFVAKLVKQTRSDEIKWCPGEFSRENVIGEVYSASVDHQSIAVYEFKYRHYTDPGEWEWNQDVAVEFVTQAGKLQWKVPETPARWELIEAIRYQAAGVDEFVKKFLGK